MLVEPQKWPAWTEKHCTHFLRNTTFVIIRKAPRQNDIQQQGSERESWWTGPGGSYARWIEIIKILLLRRDDAARTVGLIPARLHQAAKGHSLRE